MSIEISAVGCSSCNIDCCRQENDLLYVPVPMSVVQEALEKAQNDKFSLIVNISMNQEPGSPENSTSPAFITDVGTIDERKNKLVRQLETRRTPGELKELGILRSSSQFQSGAILRKSQDLERARVGNFLSKKLKMRPNKEDLVLQNILKESSVEPFVNFTQKKLKRRRLEDQIDHFIANRPSPGSIPENIMHNAMSPTLMPELAVREQASIDQHMSEYDDGELGSQTVPSPPPLPATISIDNKIRRAVTSTDTIIKSGGFVFHETQSSPPVQKTNDEIRNKQQAVLDKIRPASISLDEEVSSIYQKMTVPDLKALCRQRGFQIRQKATKAELIRLLMKSDSNGKRSTAKSTMSKPSDSTVSSACSTQPKPAIKTLPKISQKEIDDIMSRTPSALSINSPIASPMPRVATQQQSYFASAESVPASVDSQNQQGFSWNYSRDINLLKQPRNPTSNLQHFAQTQSQSLNRQIVYVDGNYTRSTQKDRVLSNDFHRVRSNPLMSSSTMSPEPINSFVYSDAPSVFSTTGVNDLSLHPPTMESEMYVSSESQEMSGFHKHLERQTIEEFEKCMQSVAAESCSSPAISMNGLDDFLSCNSPFGSTIESCNY